MRIKMKQAITGLRDGSAWPAIDDTLVVPDAEGLQLCAQGIAEPVAEAPKPERREIPASKPTKTTARK
jgi:hypothetical protein